VRNYLHTLAGDKFMLWENVGQNLQTVFSRRSSKQNPILLLEDFRLFLNGTKGSSSRPTLPPRVRVVAMERKFAGMGRCFAQCAQSSAIFCNPDPPSFLTRLHVGMNNA
jgi:hypothetical protein